MNREAATAKKWGGSAFALPHRWLLARILLWLSPRSTVKGFEICALNDVLSPTSLRKLEEALGLVAETSPAGFRRIQRDVKRIMLVRAGGPEYWPFAGGFILNDEWVQRSPRVQLALTIVHEATHARLWRAGFRYGPAVRSRIETLCVRAEASFAAKLTNGDSLAIEIQGRLANPWWTEHQTADRVRRAREQLWPRWLLRVRNRSG